MKKTYLALSVAAAAVAFSAQSAVAQDYHMEVNAGYTSYSYDAGGDDSALGVGFNYYLEKVRTSGKPLAEAAFLGHNSNVGVSYKNTDKADVTDLGLNGEYWFEKIYAAANLTRYDDAVDDGINYDLRAGYMIDPALLAYVGLEDGDGYFESVLKLGAKYVTKIGSNNVNLEGQYATSDGESVISLGGDYYLNNELSVGAEVGIPSASGAENEIELRARYFFMPNISAQASYTLNSDYVDGDSALGLGVTARF
jgi:hypothetical protein